MDHTQHHPQVNKPTASKKGVLQATAQTRDVACAVCAMCYTCDYGVSPFIVAHGSSSQKIDRFLVLHKGQIYDTPERPPRS